ncbi:hypothetical protein OAR23_01220 [bacterium]|nr:hypothetical protein [bacterium]
MQVTVSPRLTKKKKEVTEFAQKLLANKLIEGIDYLERVTPVDTGAYANSMTLNQRGDSSGPSISSRRKERGQDQNTILNEMTSRLYSQLEGIDTLMGATFVNRSPHAQKVEERYAVFEKLRSKLR